MWIGASRPLHCCASGKVFLAYARPRVVEAFLASDLVARTPNTITCPSELRRAIDEVRHDGYAVDQGESYEGVCGLAAPVFDFTGAVVGTLSVTVATDRLSPKEIRTLSDPLARSAEHLSARLGSLAGPVTGARRGDAATRCWRSWRGCPSSTRRPSARPRRAAPRRVARAAARDRAARPRTRPPSSPPPAPPGWPPSCAGRPRCGARVQALGAGSNVVGAIDGGVDVLVSLERMASVVRARPGLADGHRRARASTAARWSATSRTTA